MTSTSKYPPTSSGSSKNIRYKLSSGSTAPTRPSTSRRHSLEIHSSSSQESDLTDSPASHDKSPQSPTSLRSARNRSINGDSNYGSREIRGNGSIGASTSQHRAFKDYFAHGAHRRNVRKAPWISRPARDTEEVWIEREQEAVEWLSLFYDLVVVAVLTIFSTQHELANPAAIPIFLSFFVIIFWVWVSQTAYDMRFQGNDALNRFFKFLQIGLFMYQGAASGNWNPGKIEVVGDGDPFGTRASQHHDALQSFTTVAVTFAVSRAVLAVQFMICLIQGRRSGRQTTHIIMNIAALIASMILAVISFVLPSHNQAWKVAKIVLFYSGIVVEVANVFVAVILRVHPPLETHKVAERYGAFTLIILGEGIISVTRAFSRAISGLSNDDSGTYVQVFLTILILFLLYSFLFGEFDKNDPTGHGRAIIWQLLHFPLCFGILLLVAAMVNVVVTLSSTHGITLALNILTPYTDAVNGNGTTYLDPDHLRYASGYMNKLLLEPPFAQTITGIYGYLNETTPDVDPQVVYIQYAAQIAYTAFQQYGVEIPIEATNMYYTLYGLNTTYNIDATERAHIRDEAGHMFSEIVQEVLNDSFSGVLWLLPVAGCVLILTSLRSMLWYRFLGAAHWIYHGSQLVAGICLGLLGFLDIGPKHIDIVQLDENGTQIVNPLYRILLDEVPLVIIAMVYLVVYVGSGVAIWCLQLRQDKRDSSRRGSQGRGINQGEKAERGLGVEVDSETIPLEEGDNLP